MAIIRKKTGNFLEDFTIGGILRHKVGKTVNEGLLKLHQKLDLPLVATNDFHFLRADDHAAHDALICIQTGKLIADKNRMCYVDGLYMKSPEEMRRLFADLPQALESTLAIAEQCDLVLEFGKTQLPVFPLPAGYTDSTDFCARLLEETGVSTTPGVVYGESGEGYLRISLGTPTDRIQEAMRRMVEWVKIKA